jgi:hypothetical protein
MLDDIDDAKAYARQKFPGIQIFGYGQYTNRGPEIEFLNRTATNPRNIFVSTAGWAGIGSQTSSLAQQVCGGVKASCGACKQGYCSLGECISLIGRLTNTASATDTNSVGDESADTSDSKTTSPTTTTTTTTITTDSGVPGWGVALLALAAILVVGVFVLIALRLARPGGERV